MGTAFSTGVRTAFLDRTPGSRALFERLRATLPGGETRSITYYAPYPVALARGRGARLTDVDGNEYLDVLNNYTSLVHGHGFPPVLAALGAAAERGIAFPAPHPAQAELAELLVERYPAVARVRFTNSGSEAATLAARIARRATGRRTLVLCERGYHGSGPDFLDETSETRRIPFGAVEALSTVDDTVAAVFVEPFLGSGGVIPAPAGYLAAVAAACRRSGAVFVLDEVQSLRCAFSGVHGQLGLTPDLVLMGKVIGGGLPVGAVGGAAALLDLTASSRDGALPHSGTFNGNPLVCAAGAVALRHLDAEAIDALNRRAARLAEALEAAGREAGRPVRVTACGSILQVHPEAAEDIASLHLALLTEGVYAAPRGMLNLSTALGDDAVAAVAERYARAFRRLAEAA